MNGAELADPLAAPDSVIYDVLEIEGDSMQVTIDTAGDGSSWWTFTLQKD